MASPYNYTTPLDHSSTTGFRAWGSEFSAGLSTIGLVQTADTGQINWTTVVYSSTASTVSGYEIWRFADSTLYIKFEYGTNTGGSNKPDINVTVGTGSNGSGTLTGQLSTRVSIVPTNTTYASTTPFTTFMSRTAGHVAIAWKTQAASAVYPYGFLVIGKTVDGTGATTTTGYGVLRLNAANGALSLQSVRIASTATTYNDDLRFCAVPGNPASSLAGSNYQAYMMYLNVPDVQPFMWAAAINTNDIPRGVTYTAAQVGAAARTYFSVGQINGSVTINNYGTFVGVSMLYE